MSGESGGGGLPGAGDRGIGLALRRIWAILRREYLLRVKNKWFLITTFGFPLLIIGVAFLPGLLMMDGEGEPVRIGIVDRVGIGDVGLPALLLDQDSSFLARPAPVPPGSRRDELAGSLRASEFEAYVVLDSTFLRGGQVTVLTRSDMAADTRRALREGIRQAAVRAHVRTAGIGPSEAEAIYRSSRLGLSVARVDAEEARSRELYGAIALFFTFLLYMLFIVYGQMIMRGVLEEKTSEIAEVLVSSVRPWELMLGKILGIGSMGLTQIAIWAAALAIAAGYGLAASAPALAEAGIDVSALSVPVVSLGLAFLIFFILGYFLYASMFAAVGAIVGEEGEIQQVAFFPMLFIIVPFVLAFAAIEAGTLDSGWMVGSSLFPFFTPILMLVRITMGTTATWEVALSLVLLVLTTLAVAWLAGRIYRVGILMTGKRPTLPELLRWIRHG